MGFQRFAKIIKIKAYLNEKVRTNVERLYFNKMGMGRTRFNETQDLVQPLFAIH